jgi:cell surface protein SprA
MHLDDALDALANEEQRDSLRSLTNHVETNKNLSFSGVRLNISTRKHPMPYDPANFTFGYSRSTQLTEGQTTVYERELNWKANVNYSWSPNWKPWEPFKNLKGKSKWLDILKAQNLSYAPQNITFSTDMSRNYYELQERDLENPGDFSALPATFSQNWTWNRNFSLKWDVFKSLHFSFQSGTRAEVEEPYTQINKDLYPDRYEAWKDSVKWSLRNFGRPLDYSQNTQISYKVPLEKIPIFDWVSTDVSYNSTYSWKRGAERAGRPSLGNTINTQRTVNVNGKFDLEKLYNHSPFLKEANKRFSASNAKAGANQKRMEKEKEDKAKKEAKEKEKEARKKAEQEAMETGIPLDSILAMNEKTPSKQGNASGVSTKKKSENKGFVQEIVLYPDSDLVVSHGQKSKRVRVTARDSSGFAYNIKFKKVDENSIRIVKTPVDTIKVRLNVVALPKASEQKWYGVAQAAARFLMMLRSVSVSYRNTYNLTVPGFLPEVGDMLGQRKLDGIFSPGVAFAFGFVDDSYLDDAKSKGWLLGNDSVATPATIAGTEDVQVKMTLEPFTDLKIDLNMSRTDNRNKSIQYMYGAPPTHSGSFNMTTISIGSAFASGGSASNGYFSKTFQTFQNNLDRYQQRIEARYQGIRYPAGTGMNGVFNPENGTVNKYSADVMIPAFLDAYTGSSSLDIFPSLLKMLPNWTVNYKGLSNLPWVRDHFKSVNLTHSYKSIYAVGAYQSYSSWVECMGSGGLGFIQNTTTGSYTPNSLFDVSTVSINENFSPLLGINATLNNNMTFKVEYRTTRVLNLSMTSAQLTETGSKDFVFGWGYKINDFNISSLFRSKKASEQVAGRTRTTKGKGAGANQKDAAANQSTTQSRTSRSNKQKIAHDLNLRFDFSIRNQSAIKRDLQTNLCEATSGNMAIKTSAQIDYTLSRMVTLSLFYDRQRSEPLLSSSSYPTITQDFGMTMKFSLTR